MEPKTPEFVIIDGAKKTKSKSPPKKRASTINTTVALDRALAIAPPALFELVELLPRDEPYTPVIKAAVAALKAYLASQSQNNAEKQKVVDTIKGLREKIIRLPADDPRRAKLQAKLEKAIDKL